MQDVAAGGVASHPESCGLYPAPGTPGPVYLQRVRWRCRRGLLELDIVLGRFIDKHYLALDEAQRQAFDELLDLPDTEFWDLIAGNKEPIYPQQRAVLEYLQEV